MQKRWLTKTSIALKVLGAMGRVHGDISNRSILFINLGTENQRRDDVGVLLDVEYHRQTPLEIAQEFRIVSKLALGALRPRT